VLNGLDLFSGNGINWRKRMSDIKNLKAKIDAGIFSKEIELSKITLSWNEGGDDYKVSLDDYLISIQERLAKLESSDAFMNFLRNKGEV